MADLDDETLTNPLDTLDAIPDDDEEVTVVTAGRERAKIIPDPTRTYIHVAADLYYKLHLGSALRSDIRNPADYIPNDISLMHYIRPVINATDNLINRHGIFKIVENIEKQLKEVEKNLSLSENQKEQNILEIFQAISLENKASFDAFSVDLNPLMNELNLEYQIAELTQNYASGQSKTAIEAEAEARKIFQDYGGFSPSYVQERVNFVLAGGAGYMRLEGKQAEAMLNYIKVLKGIASIINTGDPLIRYPTVNYGSSVVNSSERIFGRFRGLYRDMSAADSRNKENHAYDLGGWHTINLGTTQNPKGGLISLIKNGRNTINDLKTGVATLRHNFSHHKYASQATLRLERDFQAGFYPEEERISDPSAADESAGFNGERVGILTEEYKHGKDDYNELVGNAVQMYNYDFPSEMLYAARALQRRTPPGSLEDTSINFIPTNYPADVGKKLRDSNPKEADTPYWKAYVKRMEEAVNVVHSPWLGSQRWTLKLYTEKSFALRMARRFFFAPKQKFEEGFYGVLSTPGTNSFIVYPKAWLKRLPFKIFLGAKIVPRENRQGTEEFYRAKWREPLGKDDKGKPVKLGFKDYLKELAAGSIGITSAVAAGLVSGTVAGPLVGISIGYMGGAAATLTAGKIIGAEAVKNAGSVLLWRPLKIAILPLKPFKVLAKNKWIHRFATGFAITKKGAIALGLSFFIAHTNNAIEKATGMNLPFDTGMSYVGKTMAIPLNTTEVILRKTTKAILGPLLNKISFGSISPESSASWIPYSNTTITNSAMDILYLDNDVPSNGDALSSTDPIQLLNDVKSVLQEKIKNAKDETEKRAEQEALAQIDKTFGLPEGTSEEVVAKKKQAGELLEKIKAQFNVDNTAPKEKNLFGKPAEATPDGAPANTEPKKNLFGTPRSSLNSNEFNTNSQDIRETATLIKKPDGNYKLVRTIFKKRSGTVETQDINNPSLDHNGLA